MLMLSQIAEPRRKKTALWLMTAAIALLYVVSLALGYVYSSVSNNIVYMNSAVMYALEIGILLLDLALYAVAFSFFVWAMHQYGFRASFPFFVSYVVLTAARRILALLLELIFAGAVGADDFVSIGIYFVFDLLTVAVVLTVIAYEFQRYNSYLIEWKKVQRDLGNHQDAPILCPFEKLFSRANPLQVCALKVSILLSAVKIVSRIIFDVFYGAPTSISDLLIMIIYYLSDILIGVLVYAAMLWIFGLLYKETYVNKNEA